MIHSYPFYVQDWRSSQDVLTMTAEARDVYRNLLDICWIDGDLPVDEELLRKLSLADVKEWRRSWRVVKQKFKEINGRLHHWKVDERRPDLIAWNEQRRIAGLKSAERRRQRKLQQPLNERSAPVPTTVERAFQPYPQPTTHNPQEPPLTPPKPCVWQPDWDRLEREYPGEVNGYLDCQLFISVIGTPEAELEFFAGLARWKTSRKWERGYVHSLTTFLRDHIWQVTPIDDKAEPTYPKVMM